MLMGKKGGGREGGSEEEGGELSYVFLVFLKNNKKRR